MPLDFYRTISAAPAILQTLFWTDLASWVGIMAHGMFYTDFVATAVYGGQPDAAAGSVYDLLFDEGVRMGSWGLLLHSITACLYAVFFQDYVTKMIGLKRSYQLGVGIFSVSMAVTVLNTSSLTCLNLAAAASGAGYAVITTIPNVLVTMYHEDPGLYYGAEAGKAGVGEDIAILDSGYYLSQVTQQASSIYHFIIETCSDLAVAGDGQDRGDDGSGALLHHRGLRVRAGGHLHGQQGRLLSPRPPEI